MKIFASLKRVEKVLDVLGIYINAARFSFFPDVSLIENILSFYDGEVEIVLCDLRALVSIKQTKHADGLRHLKFLHASLQDFLLDPIRSKEYFINPNIYPPKLLAGLLGYLAQGFYLYLFFI